MTHTLARRRGKAVAALLSFVAAVPALAAADPIRLSSAVYQEQQVVTADGTSRTEQVPVSLLSPGSEVLYVVSYANVSQKPALIEITNPLPAGLAYRSASAEFATTTAEVSVDGGKTFGRLGELMVPATGGGMRRAHAGDITTVRWKVARTVAPGEKGQVSLRAVVR